MLSFSNILITGMKSYLESVTFLCPDDFSLPTGLSRLKFHDDLKFKIGASGGWSLAAALKSFMNLRRLGGEILHYVSEYVLN